MSRYPLADINALPDDIKALAVPVWAHRCVTTSWEH